MINNEFTSKLKQEVKDSDPRANKVVADFVEQFNQFHSMEQEYKDPDIALEMARVASPKAPEGFYNVPTFRASSVSHCSRELYYLNLGHGRNDRTDLMPYHRRWLRNAHAIHDVTQRDLLYMEKYLPDPKFTMARRNGMVAWEEAVRTFKVLEHNGQLFGIEGMADGIMKYEGNFIGFEFKTKSTTLGVIGHYKMKDINESHKIQIKTYSILFGIDEFVVMYESLAKDGWNKFKDAKPDIRVFYYKVTEEDRQEILDKLSRITKAVDLQEPPEPELDKCLLCSTKNVCEWYGYVKPEVVEEQPPVLEMDLGGLIDG